LLFESLQKNWHFFVRGFQITAKKRSLGLKTAILAEKRIDSFARIDGRADWELVLKGTLTTAAGTGTFLGGILAIGGSSGLAFI
jgi:hypothetical protein